MLKLNEVSEIIMGQSPSSATYNMAEEGLPFFQGNADFGDEHPNVRMFCSNPIKIAEVSDVLLSVRAPIGAVNVADKKCCIGRGLAAIRPQKGKSITRYLFHLLIANRESLENKGTGSTFKAITGKVLNSVKVPHENVDEQKAIADILDKIVATIRKRRVQVSLCDDLVKSQFIEMFGGCSLRDRQTDWVKIGTVAEVVGGSTPKTDKKEYWDGEYYWITPAEISEDDLVVYKTQRTLTELGVRSSSLRRLPTGTILLSSRAPIGKVAIAGVEMYCNQGFKNLVCGKELNPIYGYALLKYNTEYLNSLGRGATFKEISKAIVENIYIPVPPIERQNDFARFVEQTDKSKIPFEMEVAA